MSESKKRRSRKDKLEPRSSFEIEEEIETHLILKVPMNQSGEDETVRPLEFNIPMNQSGEDETVRPLEFNIDVDVEECDAELEAAVANLNSFYRPAEEIQNATFVINAESQISDGSTQCIDDSKSVCFETSHDNITLEDNSGPVVFENFKNKESSINNIADPKVLQKSKTKKSLLDNDTYQLFEDSLKSVNICKLNEEDVFKKLDKLAQTQLSLPDQILLIETRNSWGRVLFKRPTSNQHDAKIKFCLEEVWKPWQAAKRIRDYPLSYKCYVCDKAWWHLYPFAEHINNSDHINIKLKLECKGHECSIIAFKDKKPPIRHIPIEDECWRCGNDYLFHRRQLQSDNNLYNCSHCAKGFYTCFLLKEHLPGCMQYRKSLRRSSNVCLQFYKCHLCKIVMTSKEDSFKHYSNYHDVRSDLPIVTVNKFCTYCGQIYSILLLHTCPNRNLNMICPYCSRRFPSRILLQLHTGLSLQYFRCRVCSKVLESQCMEVHHLVEKHSKNFVLIPKCLKCDGNVLLLNDHSMWRHTVIKHNRKFDRRRNYVQMVLVPKDCLSTKQIALLNVPRRGKKGPETEERMDEADINEPVDNDINIVITKTESLVEDVDDGYEIIDIADPMEIFNGPMPNAEHIPTNIFHQSNKVPERIQDIVKNEEDSDEESLIVYEHLFSKGFAEELKRTSISMEKECYENVDRNNIDSVTKIATQEESTNTKVLKIKEEPTDTAAVIRAELVDDTPDISNATQNTNFKKRINESADETPPAPKRTMIKYEEDIDLDFREDIIVLKQEKDLDVTLNNGSDDASHDNILRKVFGITKSTLDTNTEVDVKEECIEDDDVSYVEPEYREIEIISSSDEAEARNEKVQQNSMQVNINITDNFESSGSAIKVEVLEEEENAETSINEQTASQNLKIIKDINKSLKIKVLKELRRNSIYVCTRCQKNFKTYRTYMRHLPKHGFQEDICPMCGKEPRMKGKGITHQDCFLCSAYGDFMMKTANNKKELLLECKICNEYINAMQRFIHWEQHLTRLMDDPAPVEAFFPEDTDIKRLDKDHIQYIRGVLQLKKVRNRTCALCFKVLVRQGEVKRHLIEHLLKDAQARFEENDGLKCHECPKTFQKSDHFRQHLREHSAMPIYRCEICDKCFSDSSNSAKHKKIHISQLPECDLCGKKFHHLRTLARHIKEHALIGEINCDHCSKVFYSRAALNKHMRVINEKTGFRFACSICRVKYKTVKDKWDHMWQAHRKRNEVADCPICGASFRKYTDVRKHVFTFHPGRISMMQLKEMRASRNYYVARKALRPALSKRKISIEGIKIEYESDN